MNNQNNPSNKFALLLKRFDEVDSKMKELGHELDGWDCYGFESAVSTCKSCGATVKVIARPKGEEKEISGDGLESACRAKSKAA